MLSQAFWDSLVDDLSNAMLEVDVDEFFKFIWDYVKEEEIYKIIWATGSEIKREKVEFFLSSDLISIFKVLEIALEQASEKLVAMEVALDAKSAKIEKIGNTNLDVKGVMFLTGASYCFVHEGHPVIHTLKANQDQLGVQIKKETLVNGSWYKVDTETFVFCVKALRENILQNAPGPLHHSQQLPQAQRQEGDAWPQRELHSIGV